MKTTARVIGDKEILDWLQSVEKAIGEQSLVAATLAGGLPIQNAAKEKARKRTRTLARSIHIEVTERSATRATVAIGTDVEHAAIHEFGGTITAKKGTFLAIPLNAEARQYVGPRNYPRKLRFRPTPSGGVFMDGDKVVYLLRRSVTITAQPYLRPAAEEQEDEAVEAIKAVLLMQLERAA